MHRISTSLAFIIYLYSFQLMMQRLNSSTSHHLYQSEIDPLRRFTAALLGCIVKEQFPDAILVGGGATDIGFYYDCIFPQPLQIESLSIIEARMKEFIKSSPEIRSLSMMRGNAEQFFYHHHHPILAAQAASQPENIVSLIQIGSHFDLCDAPLIPEDEKAVSFKLLEIEQTERVVPEEGSIEITRITGTAFSDPQSLKKFLKLLNQWKKKDHRVLGQALNLFSFEELNGNLRCFWHPKGECLRQLLLDWWRQGNEKESCSDVSTPLVIDSPSGNLTLQHIQLFKLCAADKTPLPFHFTESRAVITKKKLNEENSLFSTPFYTTDSKTTFCKKEQLLPELISSLQFIEKTATIFNFKGHWHLVASDPLLVEALNHCGLSYSVSSSDRTVRTPYLERRNIDCLGREWPGSSLTFTSLPGNLFAVGRSLFESIDRAIGLLIEEFEGSLPLWLAPEQVRVISMGSSSYEYGKEVAEICSQSGFRVHWDSRDEKLSAKIHSAEKEKVPYIVIVGEKEKNQKLVTLRGPLQNGRPRMIRLNDFIEEIVKSLES